MKKMFLFLSQAFLLGIGACTVKTVLEMWKNKLLGIRFAPFIMLCMLLYILFYRLYIMADKKEKDNKSEEQNI